MENAKHKRRRILLHFSFGIGLPCLLLGYLAFRGIQNDQALLEKQRLNQLRRMAHLITESIHENVLEAEAAFTRAVTNLNEQQPLVSFHSLDTLKILFPLVEEVFFLESSGRIRFPVAKLLFAPDGSTNLEPNQARSSRFLKIMQEAQRYEFQQNAIQEALAIYQKALAQFSTRQLKGELLNAIARAQKKLTLFPDAISSYQQLAQDYSQVRITNGMPLGVP